jgi:hypothetical protein
MAPHGILSWPGEIVLLKNLKLNMLCQTPNTPTLFHKIRETKQKYQHHLKNLKPAAVLIRPTFINPFMRANPNPSHEAIPWCHQDTPREQLLPRRTEERFRICRLCPSTLKGQHHNMYNSLNVPDIYTLNVHVNVHPA